MAIAGKEDGVTAPAFHVTGDMEECGASHNLGAAFLWLLIGQKFPKRFPSQRSAFLGGAINLVALLPYPLPFSCSR